MCAGDVVRVTVLCGRMVVLSLATPTAVVWVVFRCACVGVCVGVCCLLLPLRWVAVREPLGERGVTAVQTPRT